MQHRALLQWTGMGTAVLTTLLFVPTLLDPFNLPKLVVLVIGAAATLGLLLGFWRDWFSVRALPLVGAVAVFIVALGVAGAAADQSLYRTLFGAWARNAGVLAYVALAVLLLAVALGSVGVRARLVLHALIWVGVVQAAYGVLQTTGNDFVAWNNPYNPIIGTVGNPNFAAALLSLTLLATVYAVLEPAFGRVRRWLLAGLALVQLFVIYRSDALQGLLAFAVGMVVLGAVWLSLQRGRLRRLVWPWLGAAVVGAVLVALGMTQRGPLVSLVFKESVLRRGDYWAAALGMLRAQPVTGVGIDSYGDWFRQFRLPAQVARPGGAEVIANNAHNVLLQLGATGGWVLLGGYLLVTAFVAWRAIVAIGTSPQRLLAGGLVAAWAAFQAQSLISIDQLGLTVWGWVLGGAIVGLSYTRAAVPRAGTLVVEPRAERGGGLSIAFAAALAVLAAVNVLPAWNTDASVREALALGIDTTDRTQVEYKRERLLDVVGDAQDPYWLLVAVNGLYEIGENQHAIDVARRSTIEFPQAIDGWNLLAVGLEGTGERALAYPARQRTVQLDPLNPAFAEQLALDKRAVDATPAPQPVDEIPDADKQPRP